MQTIKLGSGGPRVSVVGLGCMAMSRGVAGSWKNLFARSI